MTKNKQVKEVLSFLQKNRLDSIVLGVGALSLIGTITGIVLFSLKLNEPQEVITQVEEISPEKAKSIEVYGDFSNLDNVLIDYVDDMSAIGSFQSGPGYLIQVGSKQKMTYGKFAEQLEIQGITKANSTGSLNWAEADKKHYGDLANDTIKVDHDGTHYTFQVGTKTKIIRLEDFNIQLRNQGILNEDIDYTIDNLPSILTFDATKSIESVKEKIKLASIATYGDLRRQPINVLYKNIEGAIKYEVNELELNFDQLKAEATKQGFTLDIDLLISDVNKIINRQSRNIILAKENLDNAIFARKSKKDNFDATSADVDKKILKAYDLWVYEANITHERVNDEMDIIVIEKIKLENHKINTTKVEETPKAVIVEPSISSEVLGYRIGLISLGFVVIALSLVLTSTAFKLWKKLRGGTKK